MSRTCKDNTSERSNSACLLARTRVSRGGGFLQGGFLTPDQDLHSEPPAALRDQLPDGAEAENAERRSAQPMRQRARPFAALHAFGLERHVAAGRHDQGERELGRRNRRIARAGRDRNPELGAGGEVDHLGISADERDQPELRQPFEQRPGKFDAFADRDDYVGIAKALDELSEIARRLAIAYDVVMADQREAFELIHHVLVIIGNDDFHFGWVAPDRCRLVQQVVAQQPAVAGDAVASLEQAQARPQADGVVREHRLAELVLQPLDDAHRRPVAAGHDDGVRVRPVGPAAELVGGFRTDPAELDPATNPTTSLCTTSKPLASMKSTMGLSMVLLHGAPIAILLAPSRVSASTNAVAAVVAGRPDASSMRLISSRS